MKRQILLFFEMGNSENSNQIVKTQSVVAKRFQELFDPEKVIADNEFYEEACYLGPKVIYPVTWTSLIIEDEIFGLILPILVCRDLNEVVTNIKKMPTPRSAFIFSTTETIIKSLLNSLPFCIGAVNQTNVRPFFLALPLGGMGSSSMGHYYGKYGCDALSNISQSYTHRPVLRLTICFRHLQSKRQKIRTNGFINNLDMLLPDWIKKLFSISLLPFNVDFAR